MATKRYELDEAQWAKIAPLLPGKLAIWDARLRIAILTSHSIAHSPG